MGVSHPPVSRRSVGNTSKQPYFHLSACRRSSRAGIQSAIQGEWVFTRRIEDCAKPKAPGVSQAAQKSTVLRSIAGVLGASPVFWPGSSPSRVVVAVGEVRHLLASMIRSMIRSASASAASTLLVSIVSPW